MNKYSSFLTIVLESMWLVQTYLCYLMKYTLGVSFGRRRYRLEADLVSVN